MEILARVKTGKYTYPAAEWSGVSADAKQFIDSLLTFDPEKRVSAETAITHKWLKNQVTAAKLDPALPNSLVASLRAFRAETKFKKVALTVIAQQLNESDIEALRHAFASIDKNGDGKLTFQEIKDGIAHFGVNIPRDIEEVLADLDTDGSGAVDYTEFIAATVDRRTYIKEDICWSAFRVFDLDGNGKISKKELQTVLSNNTLASAVSIARAEAMIKEADINGDGEIDFDEFMAMIKKNAEPSSPLS